MRLELEDGAGKPWRRSNKMSKQRTHPIISEVREAGDQALVEFPFVHDTRGPGRLLSGR
jgi:hypothetical protein